MKSNISPKKIKKLTKKLKKKIIKTVVSKRSKKNLRNIVKSSIKRSKLAKRLKKLSISKKKKAELKKPIKKVKLITQKLKLPDTRGRSFYAADRYDYYSIHKCSLMSFTPTQSCKSMIYILGKKNVSKIQNPVDKFLAARGIKWVRTLHGGKAEFHFIPPFHLKHEDELKTFAKEEENQIPYKSQFFESHCGLYVPDLTPLVLRVEKAKYRFYLVQRTDKLYQLYVNIPGCLSFMDFDSIKLDRNIVKKNGIKIHTFDDANKLGLKLEKQYLDNSIKRESQVLNKFLKIKKSELDL